MDVKVKMDDIDKKLVEMFGDKIMEKDKEYRQRLYSFYEAISFLSSNKINLEFNA